MLGTVIAFSFVYMERVHHSHQHSVKQTSLHCNSTVHPRHPSDFRFIQGLLPEDNLQTSPILLPVVFPHTQCKHTVLVEQPLFVIFHILCLVFGWLSQSYMGRNFCTMESSFFFNEYDSSIDCEGSTTMELIQRKVLHKPRQTDKK